MASEQRVRISRACNQCRRRKSKCGGEQPHCLTCQSAGRTCTYDNGVRKRGLQSGYVRSLEIVLGLVLQHDPQLDIHIQNTINSQSPSGDALTPSSMHALARKWRDSACARAAGQNLASSAQALGESSDAHAAVPSADDDGPHSNSTECAPRIDDAMNVTLDTAPSRTLYNRRLPTPTSELVDTYFVETHCWFPVLRKADLLRSLYSDLSDVSNVDSRQLGTRLCLWAVIAYVTAGQGDTDAAFSPDDIHAHIRSAIASAGDDYELSHVQALLILVLSQVVHGRYTSAWVISAQASRMLTNLSSCRTAYDDRHVRTFHGCALLETLTSSILDRKPCLSFRDFQAENNKLDDESIDEWEAWRPLGIDPQGAVPSAKQQPLRSLSVFSLLLELVQKLHTQSNDIEDDRSVLQQLTGLQDWRRSLPAHATISDSSSWTPPNVHLHAMWCYTFCKTAGRVSRETIPEQLVADAIESTIGLIDGYTQRNPRSGCFTLLPCLFQQVTECLGLCRYSARADIVHRNETRLNRITECFKDANSMSKVTPTTTDMHDDVRDQRPSEVVDTGTSLSRIDSRRQQTLRNPVPSSTASSQNMPEAETHELSEIQAGTRRDPDPELVRYPPSGGSASIVNEFDSYFMQMSPVWPTHRVDENHIFSQNLGFLGEDLSEYIHDGMGGTDDM